MQEMVTSAVAGVIFTADPVTGEGGLVTITANWGLGETVVSGMADPDTLVVNSETGDVIERRIGTKMIRCRKGKVQSVTESLSRHVQSETGEVEERRLASPDDECCVTEDMARALTMLAIRLDKEMDCALDIEFSLTKEQEVKVLQARPITTCFTWTDWELEHELDSALAADTEILTRGNVGEVFNGALSPLTMSTVVKSLDLAIAKQAVPKTSEASYISHSTTWLAVNKHQVTERDTQQEKD